VPNPLYLINFLLKNFGCGKPPIYHPRYPHDIIEISNLTRQGISKKIAELYENGLSTKAVAEELLISKTAVRDHLNDAGVPLRSHSNNQISPNKTGRTRSIKTAPYGYCLVAGKLHEEPREQVILKLILKWWKQGMSHCAIARELNRQNKKPRIASKWSQPTVGFIIKRHQENN
jgi:DNA-binding NarL/FixJ family response regulator